MAEILIIFSRNFIKKFKCESCSFRKKCHTLKALEEGRIRFTKCPKRIIKKE